MITPTETANTKQDLTSAELEKLGLEIADLKWKVRWVYKFAQIIFALVAVFAFLWNLYQFNQQQKENAKKAVEEAKKPVKERQLALAFEISNVAAVIAARTSQDEERKKAENRLRELYLGPAIFIEDTAELKNSMIKFINCLDGQDPCQLKEDKSYFLGELSKELTNKCRLAMGLSWQIDQVDLYKNDGAIEPP